MHYGWRDVSFLGQGSDNQCNIWSCQVQGLSWGGRSVKDWGQDFNLISSY